MVKGKYDERAAFMAEKLKEATLYELNLAAEKNELQYIKKEEKVVPTAVAQTGPILELKNDFNDEKFRKNAILVTSITLVITLIIKILLFQQKAVLNTSHFTDVLLAVGQVGLLLATIIGYLTKKSYAKYSGILASFLIVFTFDIFDVIIGIFYFLFCVDQNYFIKAYQLIQKLINQIKTKKKS